MARNFRGAAVLLFCGMMSCFVGILKDHWQIHGHTTAELQRTMKHSNTVLWSSKGTMHKFDAPRRDSRLCNYVKNWCPVAVCKACCFLACYCGWTQHPTAVRSRSTCRAVVFWGTQAAALRVLKQQAYCQRRLACNVLGSLSISFMFCLLSGARSFMQSRQKVTLIVISSTLKLLCPCYFSCDQPLMIFDMFLFGLYIAWHPPPSVFDLSIHHKSVWLTRSPNKIAKQDRQKSCQDENPWSKDGCTVVLLPAVGVGLF